MRIETIDLGFQGRREVIASYLLMGGGSAAIVETGPTSCRDALLDGLEQRHVSTDDVEAVFLTHIHLDHSGGAGHVAEAMPNATFYVHEVGAPHLADPSKLWRSAGRIYGEERMEELWGETKPVPEDRLVSLSGRQENQDQETLEAAGGVLIPYDTPGHAYHHLAFFEPESKSMFTGDVTGIIVPERSYVRPPTPPPEVDIEAWLESIQKIREVQPDVIYPTHYGHHEDVPWCLDELEARLKDWSGFISSLVEEGRERDEIAELLREKGDAEMLDAGLSGEDSGKYDLAGNYTMLTDGLMRYASKKN